MKVFCGANVAWVAPPGAIIYPGTAFPFRPSTLAPRRPHPDLDRAPHGCRSLIVPVETGRIPGKPLVSADELLGARIDDFLDLKCPPVVAEEFLSRPDHPGGEDLVSSPNCVPG